VPRPSASNTYVDQARLGSARGCERLLRQVRGHGACSEIVDRAADASLPRVGASAAAERRQREHRLGMRVELVYRLSRPGRLILDREFVLVRCSDFVDVRLNEARAARSVIRGMPDLDMDRDQCGRRAPVLGSGVVARLVLTVALASLRGRNAGWLAACFSTSFNRKKETRRAIPGAFPRTRQPIADTR
jgi:hypothetical protein